MIAVAGAALLTGCSGGNADANGDGKVTVKEAASQDQDRLPKPRPGLYKTTVTMANIEFPGMPADMKGHGAGMTHTIEECLTPADVDKGYEELVKQGQNGECSYERFNVAAGKLDAVMVCKAEGRETRMEMSGVTTSTSADLEATMAMEFDGAGKGTMSFTSKHERIGDCPAK
jgi:hypothetical protein